MSPYVEEIQDLSTLPVNYRRNFKRRVTNSLFETLLVLRGNVQTTGLASDAVHAHVAHFSMYF